MKSNLNRKRSESDSFLLVVRFSWGDHGPAPGPTPNGPSSCPTSHPQARPPTGFPYRPPRMGHIRDYNANTFFIIGSSSARGHTSPSFNNNISSIRGGCTECENPCTKRCTADALRGNPCTKRCTADALRMHGVEILVQNDARRMHGVEFLVQNDARRMHGVEILVRNDARQMHCVEILVQNDARSSGSET